MATQNLLTATYTLEPPNQRVNSVTLNLYLLLFFFLTCHTKDKTSTSVFYNSWLLKRYAKNPASNRTPCFLTQNLTTHRTVSPYLSTGHKNIKKLHIPNIIIKKKKIITYQDFANELSSPWYIQCRRFSLKNKFKVEWNNKTYEIS